jgi:hypothetical protein
MQAQQRHQGLRLLFKAQRIASQEASKQQAMTSTSREKTMLKKELPTQYSL